MDARQWCFQLTLQWQSLKPQPELTPMSNASGDDEELSKALEGLYSATRTFVVHEQRGTDSDADAEKVDQAEKSVESLFGRIREERDRLEAECLMELLHEPTGKMLPVRVRTVVQSLQAELKRTKECWDFASQSWTKEVDTLRAELGRIREAALTPEEAGEILHFFKHKCEEGCDCLKCSFTPKLTQISCAGPPDKKEQ